MLKENTIREENMILFPKTIFRRAEKSLRDIIRIVLSFPFLAVGVLFWAWSIVCFIGGPDGRIGSLESILWGAGFMLFAVLCGGVFLRLTRKARWALVTLIILYVGVLAFLALTLTLTFLAMHFEHDDWHLPLLCAALFLWGISLAGGYGLFRLVKRAEDPRPQDRK